ncbi:hypothetical protein MMC17_001311 [Xylographa soralifera]|nr:hypothetical protein [Xylographa soralifera]
MKTRSVALLLEDYSRSHISALKDLVHYKGNPLLTSFFDLTNLLLREEISRQPQSVQGQIPDFSTLLELVEKSRDDTASTIPAVEYSLSCTYQIGALIWYFSKNPWISNEKSIARIFGLGSGLLAAVAISCAHGVADLPSIGAATVSIAFRTGIEISQISGLLVPQPTLLGPGELCWSVILKGLDVDRAQKAIYDFHISRRLPASGQAYVSAIWSRDTVVSGPPATLKSLKEMFGETDVPIIQPSSIGMVGAPHLYDVEVVRKILHGSKFFEHSRTHLPRIPMFSTVDGERFFAPTTQELLQQCLLEILTKPINFPNTCNAIVAESSRNEQSLFALGSTEAVDELLLAMNSSDHVHELIFKDISPSEKISRNPKSSNSKIAIVGLAGRFPSAADPELLWELLQKGLDVHREVTPDRFDIKAHLDPSGKIKNTTLTPYGCFIDEAGLFDPRFFNMSPREAKILDPMQRLALITAYEALEMSGWVKNRTQATRSHRVGTFYGQASDDWREVNASQDIDTYFIPCGIRAFTPGRVNYFNDADSGCFQFKFGGPSYSIDTACSSSFAAMNAACNSLWAGDCDTAVTGGVNVLTNPDIFAGLSRGQFLSKTGGCKTFDNEADGYCRADAVGSFVLKRLEDAVMDKDNIFGVILNVKTNHSADAVSITHPNADQQGALYQMVVDETGIDPHEVEYVEMHGTGTQAGDYNEMLSVTDVFASDHGKQRINPLYVGSVKANVGHGEAAAGVMALMKVLMMLKHNAIPPHVGIKSGILNESFPKNLLTRNVHIPFAPTTWLPHKDGKRRLAFLNNFSAAGGNTAMLIEEGPVTPPVEAQDPRSTMVVAVSGKSITSLQRNISNLAFYLDENPATALADLSYTTTVRRHLFDYRVAFAVQDVVAAKDLLLSSIDNPFTSVPGSPPQAIFTFTGQGSAYCSLGKILFETSAHFRNDLLRFERIVHLHGFESFRPLIDGSVSDVDSLSPQLVQVGLTCVQIALARLWISWGVQPAAVLGHSLGEFAALHIAGVLSISDTIYLVGSRAKVLQEACVFGSHAMLAVKSSVSAVTKALNGKAFEIACINGSEELVLGGTQSAIDEIASCLASEGLKAIKLHVPFAFHTSQVDPILDAFEIEARSAVFTRPAIPVISPLLGKVVTEAEFDASYLRRHSREKVDFLAAITVAQKESIVSSESVWIEIGSHPVCLGMIKSTLGYKTVTAPSLRRNEDPWKTLSESVANLCCQGVPIKWSEFHIDFNDAHRLLTLPSYSFDLKKYWIDYKNNWCLTKGDVILPIAGPGTVEAEPAKSKLSTTTVQRILREEISPTFATLLTQSSLAEPSLRAAIQGHLVNGVGLCPSSIYADAALVIANYLNQQMQPGSAPVDMDVCSMEVSKPLILAGETAKPQLLQISAVADIRCVQLEFFSVSEQGKKLQDHAKCLVKYGNVDKWLAKWNQSGYLIKSRIQSLENDVKGGRGAHQIGRGLAYKLFKALVDYDEKYRGMDEVILDSANFEAVSKVTFKCGASTDGTYFLNPRWIDSLAHLSGFIVNASDATDSNDSVYISHGWRSMRLSSLSASKTYRAYVKMQDAKEAGVKQGDVFIFDGSTIVGVVGGLKFQCIPRKLLNMLLPPVGTTSSKHTPAKSAPVKQFEPAPLLSQTGGSLEVARIEKAAIPAISESSVISKTLRVVANECEVDISDLVDSCAFENIGIDSLLSLTILAKLREDIDPHISSSLFLDHSTVGDLKKYLTKSYPGPSSRLDHFPAIETYTLHTASVSTTDLSLPALTPSRTSTLPNSGTISPIDNRELSDTIRTTIADEMGVDLDEVSTIVDLTSMGMDSLMSLSILAGLREKTGLSLPSNLLYDCLTIDDIERKICGPVSKSLPALASAQIPPTSVIVPERPSSSPKSVSFLMQGDPKTALTKLFLFPDGSGSASSYAPIPILGTSICVYGLNCPFMKTATAFNNGIDGVAAIYLEEVKRRQPHGPYNLGGWSAGGVLAYEAALQLHASGETVSRLILLDAPCPVKLEPVPSKLFRFFDSVGVLGNGNPKGTPDWVIPHFEAMIRNLDTYVARKYPAGKEPQTLAIWARGGVCEKPGDPRPVREDSDPKVMDWLLNARTDFGSNGWGQLLGETNIRNVSMEGHHFNMITEPRVQELGRLMRLAFEE